MNKKTRLILLVAVTVIALFAAVVPALAGVYPVMYQIQSFERDLDNDGNPDFWALRGNVDWVCFDKELYDGYCGVLFGPSGSRSVAYIGATPDGFTTNEEGIPGAFAALVIAKDLDANRAIMGIVYHCDDTPSYKVYGYLPGGTYKGKVETNGIISVNDSCEPDHFRAGVMLLPGGGQILFDAVDENLVP